MGERVCPLGSAASLPLCTSHLSPGAAEPRPDAWEADLHPDLGVALPPGTTQRVPPAHCLIDTIHPQPGELAQPLDPRGKGAKSLLFFFFFFVTGSREKQNYKKCKSCLELLSFFGTLLRSASPSCESRYYSEGAGNSSEMTPPRAAAVPRPGWLRACLSSPGLVDPRLGGIIRVF